MYLVPRHTRNQILIVKWTLNGEDPIPTKRDSTYCKVGKNSTIINCKGNYGNTQKMKTPRKTDHTTIIIFTVA